MDFITENWYLLVAAACMAFCAILAARNELRRPKEEQLDNLREWLLWAVVQAEAALGAGTGQLKLRMVYDLFLSRFPALALVLPFERFSALVDDALEEMQDVLGQKEAQA